MKKFLLLLTTLSVALLLGSSFSPGPEYFYDYTPVFMKAADLHSSVKYVDGKREMSDPGKIYIKENKIYVNEKYKGFHVIDNSNPRDPKQIGFISVPGSIDMAIKDNIMYFDNAIDLVAFDLLTNQVTKRIEGFFPEHLSPDGDRPNRYDRPEDLILVGWKKK